jgi:aerobic carbon-monoxide dehydrogenase large subunit
MNVHDTSGAFDMNKYGIGQPVRRTEDPILVQGQGRYTDDLNLPHQAYAVFVRSRNGHGIIKALDTAAAKAMPGVLAIYTGADLASYGTLKCAVPFKNRDGSEMKKPTRPSMPSDKVRFVGDPIAVVIAKTLAQAKDAAEAVEVDIETLPSVTQASEAAKPGAPQLYDDVPGNVALDYLYGEPEKVAEAFAKAAHVTKLHLVNSRLVVNAMEPRSAIASFDKESGRYTMNIGCQGAFGMKGQLVDILGTTPDKVHVLTGNVGGSFGMKAAVYPEYVPLLHAAKELGVPVKWTADRFESFVSDHHGRDHEFDGELALDEKGKFLAARFKGFGNTGAYLGPVSPLMSTLNIVKNAVSVYKIPLIEVATKVMFTNTVLVSAYRGAGRPEGNYYMERLIDRAAEEMGIDRFALRKRNQIRKSEIPYKSSSGMQYDSGDFPAIFERAVELADIKGFKQRKRESKKRGKLRCLGVGSYLEVTAPPNKEMGGIRFEENGDVTIITGTLDYGQGHAAPFAQVLTEKLGVPFERIKLLQGDSDELLAGGGTGGSRSMYASGTAILEGADEVIKKGKQIAGFVLEASAGDIEFANGTFTIAGTDRAIDIMELADKLRGGLKVPDGVPNSLSVKHVTAEPIPSVFPNGCHVAEVEIDPDTGVIEIVSYNSVNDFGTIINPLLVAGQVHGGVVQGIGQALMEKTAYDADGQLLTGSYMDYAMPRAEDMPEIGFESHPVPAKNNPLGVKGCGEAGCAGALTCVMNAIVDALSEYGVANVEMPATPERVWQTIQDARARHTM